MLTTLDKIKFVASSMIALSSVCILKACFVETEGHGFHWIKDNPKVFICSLVILIAVIVYQYYIMRKIRRK
jgi:hypothetical protein